MSFTLNVNQVDFTKLNGSKKSMSVLVDHSTEEALRLIEERIPDDYSEVLERTATIPSLAPKYKRYSKTVTASNWTGTEPPYTASITINGVTENSDIQIMPDNTITATQAEAWMNALVLTGSQAENTIRIMAFGEKPSTDIPISILVGGDVVGGE